MPSRGHWSPWKGSSLGSPLGSSCRENRERVTLACWGRPWTPASWGVTVLGVETPASPRLTKPHSFRKQNTSPSHGGVHQNHVRDKTCCPRHRTEPAAPESLCALSSVWPLPEIGAAGRAQDLCVVRAERRHRAEQDSHLSSLPAQPVHFREPRGRTGRALPIAAREPAGSGLWGRSVPAPRRPTWTQVCVTLQS